jgi:hypothetical protein
MNPRLTPAGRALADQEFTRIQAGLAAIFPDEADRWAANRRTFNKMMQVERSTPAHRTALKKAILAEQGGLCASCGQPIIAKGAVNDRYEAVKGYCKGNVRVICQLCDTSIQQSRGYKEAAQSSLQADR